MLHYLGRNCTFTNMIKEHLLQMICLYNFKSFFEACLWEYELNHPEK